MSASETTLPCPICLHDGVFNCAKSLRDRLIHVSTNNVSCPVCQEEVCGLDKLTIHLFTHVKLITTQEISAKEENNIIAKKLNFEERNDLSMTLPKKLKPSVAKNKTSPSTSNGQIKFVKIYPKLPVLSLCNLSVIDFNHESTKKCVSSNTNKNLPTLNKEKQPKSDVMCDLCGLQFFDADILKMHRCLVHSIDDNKQQNILSRYYCHLCSKNFKMRGSLMVHLRVAHFGTRTESKSKIKSDISAENKVNLVTESTNVFEANDHKQWQCDVCKKYFTTKYFLKKHKRLHTGETPYACTQCNKSFTFQQSYHKHLLYHNDEKPHICNFCGRAFKELSTLHNHQRIHTGEKPFSCETCGKCFRQRVSYLVHRRIHTGVMPYKCTACEKSFRYKVSQRTHKCQAQPPGTVVRQSGNLVQKLKQKCIDDDIIPTDNFSQFSPNNMTYLEVSEANAELVRTGAKLSLEDTETESFNLIAQAFTNDEEQNKNTCLKLESHLSKNNVIHKNKNITDDLTKHELSQYIDNCIPSPSDILKNLSLSSDIIKPIKQNRETEDRFDLYSGCNLFPPN